MTEKKKDYMNEDFLIYSSHLQKEEKHVQGKSYKEI